MCVKVNKYLLAINAKNKIHNSFEDPSKDSYESDEHAMEIYNQTVKDISNWIEQLDF